MGGPPGTELLRWTSTGWEAGTTGTRWTVASTWTPSGSRRDRTDDDDRVKWTRQRGPIGRPYPEPESSSGEETFRHRSPVLHRRRWKDSVPGKRQVVSTRRPETPTSDPRGHDRHSRRGGWPLREFSKGGRSVAHPGPRTSLDTPGAPVDLDRVQTGNGTKTLGAGSSTETSERTRVPPPPVEGKT